MFKDKEMVRVAKKFINAQGCHEVVNKKMLFSRKYSDFG